MLIDDLISNPILVQFGVLTQELRGRLSKAPKFMLRRDFAMAADEFSLDVDNVSKVLPLARLPYPECWLEVAQADRRHFAAGPLGPTDGELSRVGFLLTQTSPQGAWSAQMFWSFAAAETFMGIRLPPATSGLLARIDPHQADAIAATSFHLDGDRSPFLRQLGRASAPEDWIGEPGFLIAVLALMNSRNAAETVLTEPNNKQRKSTGKPLLFGYHLVCIPERYRARHLAAAGDDPSRLRAHFVRGHFKVRKTGIFFWSAYQRGDPALGFVHKDYVLARREVAA